ncbi:STAS domain-containing protein [Bacillus marinisedimentorum]|uniref:STAS domain-containing protein n=1 Tax=Bacillus marinisedimentorum TaxID=1821260 RepID=UPI0007DEC9FC|nr:STAS domain-containing protein [Bacillus marinisedimentorum]
MTELELLKEKLYSMVSNLSEGMTKEQNKLQSGYSNTSIQNDVISYRSEFILIIADAMVEDFDTSMKRLTEWVERGAKAAIEMNIPMEEPLKSAKVYRTHLWNAIKKITKEHDLSVDTLFEAASRIDPLLDEAVYLFGRQYIKDHERTLKHARMAFMELSAPIVQIDDSAAVLPIIGDIDTYRAQVIMDQSMEKATELDLSRLYIDLSGVTEIDTAVAQEIIKISSSLKLLGVEPVLTGIRPEIALTLTHLGINLPSIQTESSLKQAIQKNKR